ncbi:ABC transporter ATP-binding protein, partial [bacterium]|nr:ABC transporter ATP-binding protein [bacterium]
MELKQTLPHGIADKLGELVGDAEPQVALRADIGADGTFGEQWLVVAGERLLALGEDGVPSAAGAESAPSSGGVAVLRDFPLSDVTAVEIENLVGAGAFQVTVRGQAVEMVRFSNALSRDFGVAARLVDKLVKDGALPELPDEGERRFCPSCNRPLIEGSQVCTYCLSKVRTIGRLLTYLRPYWWRTALIVGLMVVSTAIGLMQPWLVGFLTDKVLTGPLANTWMLLPLFLGMVAVHLSQTGISIAHGVQSVFVGYHVVFDLRAQLYQKLQYLSLSYYDKRQTGAVMTRVSHDTGELQHFIVDAVPWTVIAMFQLAGVTTRMFWKSWALTLCVLVPIPLLILMTRLLLPRLFVLLRRFFERRSRLSAVLNDSLSGIRVVKAFGQEDTEIDRFDTRNQDLRDAGLTLDRWWASVMPVLGLVSMAGGIIIYYFGGRSVLLGRQAPNAGYLTFGGFVEFTLLVPMLRRPIEILLRMSHRITHALTSAERVFEIIDTDPDVKDDADAVDIGEIQGKIELRDVTFGYVPHMPVLRDINLTLEPGEMVGLVGHSGAGKSTLINLICRFYDVDDGQVFIDGVDIKKIRLRDLHAQIGVVLQETFLFSGTIADNIAYGKPKATRLELMTAAKAANAHDFIVGFSDGYDTQVGERGSRLSGGEKQRISIAR